MKSDPRSTEHLVPQLRAVSLFIAIGLFGAGCSGFMSSNAQQAEMKTDTEMEMATTGIFKPDRSSHLFQRKPRSS